MGSLLHSVGDGDSLVGLAGALLLAECAKRGGSNSRFLVLFGLRGIIKIKQSITAGQVEHSYKFMLLIGMGRSDCGDDGRPFGDLTLLEIINEARSDRP